MSRPHPDRPRCPAPPSSLTSDALRRSTRAPGMHLGHDLLLAVTIAAVLLVTLLLYSAKH